MQGRLRSAATLLACTAIVTTAATAQGSTQTGTQDSTQSAAGDSAKKPQCNAITAPTEALARGTFSLQRAFQGMKANRNETVDLKAAIKALTTPPKNKDEHADSLGRAYYLGQAYILLLQEPGIKPVGRRGDYGIATDTVLSIDLLAAADTAFHRVETAMPECRTELAAWRQQKPWLDALNGAITAMNAGQNDSAEALAKRSLLIDRTTPYPYSILGNVANNRKDYTAAIAYFKQAIATAGEDTTYKEARLTATFDLANAATQRANNDTSATKAALVQEAIADWHTFIPVGTQDMQVANAEQLIVQLYKSLHDSTNLADAYAQVIANPAAYGEQTLLNAGVIATRARKPTDAATLFSAVLAKNPNQRDALNNLAASYVGSKEQQKMLPLIDRLVSLDPDNPANWMLYAYAYSGLLKETKDPKLVKAYTDSAVKYNTKAEKLPAHVSLSEFSHGKQLTTLSGTIENQTAASKTYTMQVQFLDTAGTVVDTQTTTVGPVLAKGSAPFSVTSQTSNVAAFRYTLTP